jgi:hypothetical protein
LLFSSEKVTNLALNRQNQFSSDSAMHVYRRWLLKALTSPSTGGIPKNYLWRRIKYGHSQIPYLHQLLLM